jgi:hypothetical protein
MTWVTAQRVTAIAYVTSMFLSAMDIAIVNVALPTPVPGIPRLERVGPVDSHRLRAEPGYLDPGLRADRRPDRHETRLSYRPYRLHPWPPLSAG